MVAPCPLCIVNYVTVYVESYSMSMDMLIWLLSKCCRQKRDSPAAMFSAGHMVYCQVNAESAQLNYCHIGID